MVGLFDVLFNRKHEINLRLIRKDDKHNQISIHT